MSVDGWMSGCICMLVYPCEWVYLWMDESIWVVVSADSLMDGCIIVGGCELKGYVCIHDKNIES